jgi:hypothetical protein
MRRRCGMEKVAGYFYLAIRNGGWAIGDQEEV